jgi:serine/threonine protein kinase
MIGETLKGRYRIEQKIGEGAMGKVYRAIDQQTQEIVAIKMMSKELAKDEAYRKRFGREAQALAKLKHPNIVGYVDAFSEQGDGYLVTEFFGGGDLRGLIKRAGPMQEGSFKGMMLKILDAVATAHGAGIIHRDLKPENILLSAMGEPHVGDFGLARDHDMSTMTATGTVMGTLAYMPPEAFDAFLKQDQRGDIWALGVIMFEMLTGGLPFRARSQTELIAAILNDMPITLHSIRRDLPAAWPGIIELCLQKEVSQRYQSVRDIYHDLRSDRLNVSGAYGGYSPSAVAVGAAGVAAAVGQQPTHSITSPTVGDGLSERAIKPLQSQQAQGGPSPSGLRYVGENAEASALPARRQADDNGLMFLTRDEAIPAPGPAARYSPAHKYGKTAQLRETPTPPGKVSASAGVMMLGGVFLWGGICVVLLSGVMLLLFVTQADSGVSYQTISTFIALGSVMFSIGLFFEAAQEEDWRQGALALLALTALGMWVVFFSRLIFANTGTLMGMVGYILLILMYFQVKRGD